MNIRQSIHVVGILLAVACAHNSQQKSEQATTMVQHDHDHTDIQQQQATTDGRQESIQKGPETIRTITVTSIAATPTKPARTIRRTQIIQRGPVVQQLQEQTTSHAQTHQTTNHDGQQQQQTKTQIETKSSTRVGPGFIFYLCLAAGLVAAALLAWRWRRLILPWLALKD